MPDPRLIGAAWCATLSLSRNGIVVDERSGRGAYTHVVAGKTAWRGSRCFIGRASTPSVQGADVPGRDAPADVEAIETRAARSREVSGSSDATSFAWDALPNRRSNVGISTEARPDMLKTKPAKEVVVRTLNAIETLDRIAKTIADKGVNTRQSAPRSRVHRPSSAW